MRYDGVVMERPQHMFMRVALGIHGSDLEAAFRTYNLMSSRYFIHASPTLFNAGTTRPQLSSCFLLTVKEDSIEGIYDTPKLCAAISKYAGGIGLSIQHIRATDSYIRGSNGTSNGLVPMLRVLFCCDIVAITRRLICSLLCVCYRFSMTPRDMWIRAGASARVLLLCTLR